MGLPNINYALAQIIDNPRSVAAADNAATATAVGGLYLRGNGTNPFAADMGSQVARFRFIALNAGNLGGIPATISLKASGAVTVGIPSVNGAGGTVKGGSPGGANLSMAKIMPDPTTGLVDFSVQLGIGASTLQYLIEVGGEFFSGSVAIAA